MMNAEYRALLQRWFRGNLDACFFIEQVFNALHVWDDLIDRDKAIPTESINVSMEMFLLDLPRNRFYVENFAALNSLLTIAILNWHIANQLETEQASLDVAFIIRSSYIDLITMSAAIIGGRAHAIMVGHEARPRASREGFETYRLALTQEHRQMEVI